MKQSPLSDTSNDLLDKTYLLGLMIKAFDGSVELLGALVVALISPQGVLHFTQTVAHWFGDHSLVANYILNWGSHFSQSNHIFALLFLVTHGAVKIGLVVALLQQKHWAYPWALAILIAFLIYQAYLLFTQPTIGMALLTVLDVIIIGLVWREWKKIVLDHNQSTRA